MSRTKALKRTCLLLPRQQLGVGRAIICIVWLGDALRDLENKRLISAQHKTKSAQCQDRADTMQSSRSSLEFVRVALMPLNQLRCLA